MAVTLFHITRITQDNTYEAKTSDFIDIVYENISLKMSPFFSDGLLGIGCGFQYLINEHFVEGNSDEILEEMDIRVRNIVDSRFFDNISLENGVCGVGCYLWQRLKNKPEDNESFVVLKLKEYLIYLGSADKLKQPYKN